MNARRAGFLCCLLLGSIAGSSDAAIPGPGGVISACLDSKGAMRIIDAQAGAQCTNRERSLTFNAAGQAGAPGATGPAGPTGPSDAYVAPFGGFSPFPVGEQTLASLDLPAGDYVIDALLRLRGSVVTEDPASFFCQLVAQGSVGAQLDVVDVTFFASESGTAVKVSPLRGWISAPGAITVHLDCELFDNAGADSIGVDESSMVAVRYGTLHTPPEPPPDD
jgi:hypothetical protein